MDLPDEPLTIVFDGSSVPKNPGGVALSSFAILDGKGTVLHEEVNEVCRGPEATNNIAEWHGVLSGIRVLHASQWRNKLTIRGDSELVIKQLNLEYRCKAENLKPYLAEAHRLLGSFMWEAVHNKREHNTHADQMIRDYYEAHVKHTLKDGKVV